MLPYDNEQCEPWESCARLVRSDVNQKAFVCILTKYCGQLGNFPAYTGHQTQFVCESPKPQFPYPEGYESLTTCLKRQEYNQRALLAHNKYRRKHQVGDLVLSEDLRLEAQRIAEKLSSKDQFMNDYGTYTRDGCGENQARNANTQLLFNTDWATDKWYSYVKYYNYNEPGYNKVARTFTRVVWKSTTEVGFGIAGKYVVARYCPKGNVKGEYSENVFEMNACSETQRLVEEGVCQDCPAYERRFGGLN